MPGEPAAGVTQRAWAVRRPEPGIEGALGEQLRGHERAGRPLRDKTFVQQLERMLGRALLPKKRGPKPKAKGQEA
jgi:hypothetical protein